MPPFLLEVVRGALSGIAVDWIKRRIVRPPRGRIPAPPGLRPPVMPPAGRPRPIQLRGDRYPWL